MPKIISARTQKQLASENEVLRVRLEEAEETLRAIRNGEVDALIVSGVDGEQIYTLKQAEEQIRHQAILLERVNDAIVASDAQYRITVWNAAAESLYGWKAEEVLGRSGMEILRTEVPEVDADRMKQTITRVGRWRGEATQARKDGTRFPVDVSSLVLRDEKGQISEYINVYRDITERKQAEASLASSEQEYRALFENMPIGLYRTRLDGQFVDANPAMVKMFGFLDREALLKSNVIDLYQDAGSDQKFKSEISKTDIVSNFKAEFKRPDGTTFWTEDHNHITRDNEGKPLFYEGSLIDITERKQAEERIQKQLDHLTALSNIDRVISSNFNLGLSLSEILTYVTLELGVDAADILILDSITQVLEFGAERGFRSMAVKKMQVRLGANNAGRVALERQLIQIPNLRDEPDNPSLTPLLMAEEFICYFGIPLIAKGQVKGVLEIFHRSPLVPDTEWFDFLNTLASQTAIAIENATLFSSLQRSNLEINIAYDATIEGWSHALDLRDKETEGHTQRVTEMTLKLARAFGLSEAELVQVRWGALLHDIGKMGVPDGVLLKPGPLTDEEWIAMKKHPTFAFEMLSPIRYLRLALDLPYCHHEKWDGTGYPRGLKGEQIPLVARIFAVVDVWDALSSDRPYRAAWSEQKVREHILSSSGTHFEPKVVDAFMKILK